MRFFLACLLWIISAFAHAQPAKALDLPMDERPGGNNDSSSWHKHIAQLQSSLSLPDLTKTTDSFYCRIWGPRQVVDVRSANGSTFSGTVTSFAIKYNEKNPADFSKTVSKQAVLSGATASNIFMFFDTACIATIPNGHAIKGWSDGLDGWTISIEIASPTHYALRAYWMPLLFKDSLVEARKIQAFVDHIFKEQKLGKYYQRLKVPPGKYVQYGIPGIQIPAFYGPPAQTITDML
jgi:hypothetical protein